MDIVKNINKEWERTLFCLVLLLLLCAGVFCILCFVHSEDGHSQRGGSVPANPHFFDWNTTAYLDGPHETWQGNPLAFRHHAIVMRVYQPPKETSRPPAQVTTTRPPAQVTTTRPPAQVTTTTFPHDTPDRLPRKIKVMYSGYTAVEGSQSKAWIQIEESDGSRRESGHYERGSVLLGNIQVEDFDGEHLMLRWNESETATIGKGKRNAQEVTVE